MNAVYGQIFRGSSAFVVFVVFFHPCGIPPIIGIDGGRRGLSFS